MSDIRQDRAGVLYKYFWLKIASEEEVNRQRRSSLEKGEDERTVFLHPTTIGINPAKKKSEKILAAARDCNAHLGFLLDLKQAQKHKMLVDFIEIETGHDRASAQEWIHTEDGKDWAGNSFCVLCYAAIEPV